jgi:hypothetical protein
MGDTSDSVENIILYDSLENITAMDECNLIDEQSNCVTRLFNRLCQCIVWMFLFFGVVALFQCN